MMETWNPLTGEIPPDPPRVPWHSRLGDPPSKIIARMREVWDLVDAGTPEYAQALFNKAGAWIDYWLTARDAGGANIRAGVRSTPSPDSEIAPAVVFAIYAARQAVLSGRYDLLAFAREYGEQVASVGRTIEKANRDKAGGDSRKGKYAPIRMAVEMLVGKMGKNFKPILDQMRIDADTYDHTDGDSDSVEMGDIRGHDTTPINLRFLEVPDDRKNRKGVVRYEVNGKKKTITIGTLENYVSNAK